MQIGSGTFWHLGDGIEYVSVVTGTAKTTSSSVKIAEARLSSVKNKTASIILLPLQIMAL